MNKSITTLLLMLLLTITTYANAAPDSDSFAEKKVVLQISDPDPFKQTLVLNVASNLKKHYGQDKVDIEIVAFGPGLRLMFANNANSKRIESLASSDVVFTACGNTIDKVSSTLGHKPILHSKSNVVPGGAVRILDLVSQGYVLLKP